MKTLVTGASGFVGRRFIELNEDLIGIDIESEGERIIKCDVRNVRELVRVIEHYDIENIVHLAGAQYDKYIKPKYRSDYFHTNIEMAESIRTAASLTKIQRIVYVSTDMVYGSKISSPVSEKTDTFPIGPYGLSKLKAEQILQLHQNKFSLSILRPRLIIGPGRLGTIEKLARLINSGLPVFVIGNGKNRYQFISVDDICSALNLLLVYSESGVFNIGSDDPPTVEELFENTFNRLGIRNRILKVPSTLALYLLKLMDVIGYSPLASEQFRLANLDYVLDTSKLKDKLGWKPKFRDDQLLAQALQPLLDPTEH